MNDVLIGPVKQCGLYGYIRPDGHFGIAPNFEELGRYSEGLVAFREGKKVGFLDSSGRVAIQPSYDDVESLPQFRFGLAAMSSNGKMGYINKSGVWQIQPGWNFCWNFFQQYSLAESPRAYCVLDQSGRIISTLGVDDISRIPDLVCDWNCFRCLFLRKHDGLREGCLNWRGEIVVKPEHFRLTDFSQGIAGFSDMEDALDARWGLVDRSERIVKSPEFYDLKNFCQGLASAGKSMDSNGWVDVYGYVDTRGEWVIPAQFNEARVFSGGMACVGVGKRLNRLGEFKSKPSYGFINTRGKMVIEPVYSSPSEFLNGFAIVEKDGRHSVIDKCGRIIWEN